MAHYVDIVIHSRAISLDGVLISSTTVRPWVGYYFYTVQRFYNRELVTPDSVNESVVLTSYWYYSM